MKRFLFYSHDTFGLGNVRRMLAIAEQIVRADTKATVLLISGSNAATSFALPERVDVLKLPTLKRDSAGHYGVRSLGIEFDALIELRANLILSAMLDFRPDTILVDKKPYGVNNELAKVLHVVRRRVQQPRLVLLLRDILDDANTTRQTWAKNAYHEAVAEFYDAILVAGDPRLYDLAAAYAFPKSSTERLTYCGIIEKAAKTPRAKMRIELGLGDQQLILITPGGGEDGGHLIHAYLNCFLDRPISNCRSLIVLGSEFNADEAAKVQVRAAASTHLQVMRFTQDMPSLLQAADAVLCMGGYNTLYEAIALRQRPVVVPRVQPVREQWIRASRVAELGYGQCLHPDSLSPQQLRLAIERALGGTVQPSLPLHFNGLENIAEALLVSAKQRAIA